VNKGNLQKKLFDGTEFYLKPNEGFERQGQLKTTSYEQVRDQLRRFPQFKNWQLQEFIKSYTKADSFLRSVCVIVVQNGNVSLYNSQINEFTSVKKKSDGMVTQSIGNWVYHDDGCQLVTPMNKHEYSGKLGIANEEYNNLLGDKYYEKHILPKINQIIKEAVLSIGKLKNYSEKLAFHIFGVDLMIDTNLEVKLLEFNPYPTHFVNARSECNPLEVVYQVYNGKRLYDKLVKYESQLLDELLSVTVDNIFTTSRKVKLRILKKLL
jgi:hypothetical protein